MKELFEQYEQIRRLAETAVERVAHLIRIHHAPDQALCEQVSVLLTGLLSRYKAIPQAMTGQLHRVAMPFKGSTVPEYRAAWEESIARSHEYARDVLGDVGRIRSDDPHYADAIRPLQEQAQALLDAIPAEPEAPFRTDLHAWEVLIEACATASPLPDKLLEALSNCGEALPRPVVFGLLLNKYRLGGTDDPAPDEDNAPASDDIGDLPDLPDEVDAPAADDLVDLPSLPDEVDAPAADDLVDFPDLPDEVDAPASDEPGFPDLPEDPADAFVPGDDPMIHPVEPLKPLNVPSEQKLTELIRATHPVSAALLKNLGFLGLMDMQQVYIHLASYEPEAIDRTVSLLISRGYLAVYYWLGRQVICFTPQMNECVEKPDLALTLRNLMRQKKLESLTFLADDNIPRDAFVQRLARVDFLHSFLVALRKDPDALALLHSTIHGEHMAYYQKLVRPGHPPVLLLLTTPEELRATPAAAQQGAICHADVLPDMTGVEDDLHFCLTPDGFHQWCGGAWIRVRR